MSKHPDFNIKLLNNNILNKNNLYIKDDKIVYFDEANVDLISFEVKENNVFRTPRDVNENNPVGIILKEDDFKVIFNQEIQQLEIQEKNNE